jgi:hypothetical protein
MKKCEKQSKIGDSTVDVSFAGRNLGRGSISTIYGMLRVSQRIVIIAVVPIIVLQLCHSFGKAHSSSYYYAPHTTAWSNGLRRWET